MSLLLVGCGLGLVMLPGLTRHLARSLRPSVWTKMSFAALVSGAALTEMGLVLYATPTVLRAVGGAQLADACQEILGTLGPGDPITGWMAMAVAISAAAAFHFGLWRVRRVREASRVEPVLGTRDLVDHYEVVVLPGDVAFAVSVAGSPGQVIVSRALVDTLTADELAVVLRHERAHLDLRHEARLSVISAIEHGFGFLPPVRRSGHALRCAIERWADDVAVEQAPEARDLLRWALIKVAGSLVDPSVAAFSGADTVAERLHALDAAPPDPSALSLGLLITPGIVLGGGGTASLAVCFGSIATLIAMAGHCAT